MYKLLIVLNVISKINISLFRLQFPAGQCTNCGLSHSLLQRGILQDIRVQQSRGTSTGINRVKQSVGNSTGISRVQQSIGNSTGIRRVKQWRGTITGINRVK